MSNTTNPTPIVDKNGKHTTVHKKSGDATTGVSRVAALGAAAKPEKRTVVAEPTYGYYPNLKKTDVVEVGARKSKDDNTQELFLNGVVIGRISSNDETQHHKIAGSRLSRTGGVRKVWRAYGSAPRIGNENGGRPLSSDDFSKGKAAYDLANQMSRANETAREYRNYIDNGGVYIDKGEGYDSGWEVRGTPLAVPEGTTVKVRKESGHLATGALLMKSDASWTKAEIEFADDSGQRVWVSFGYDGDSFAYSFERDGSLWSNGGNGTPSDSQQEFIDKVEQFTKGVFVANKAAL